MRSMDEITVYVCAAALFKFGLYSYKDLFKVTTYIRGKTETEVVFSIPYKMCQLI